MVLCSVVSIELDKLCIWFQVNKLSLNTSKTNFMIFTNRSCDDTYSVCMNGLNLSRVFVTKFLGVHKCSNLLHTTNCADDTTLTGNISTFELRNGRTLDENIHFELLKLTDWLKVNKLSINANKTKLMIFHMPQRKLNPPIIKIDDIQLEPISNFNFLGIIINENIKWSKHINKISYSISKTIGITVVPATAGPLGERPPALAGHFCNVPTNVSY